MWVMKVLSYWQEVIALSVLVADLLCCGKPHKVGGLFALITVLFDKLAKNGNPCLVGSVAFEEDGISQPTFEIAQPRANDPILDRSLAFARRTILFRWL